MFNILIAFCLLLLTSGYSLAKTISLNPSESAVLFKINHNQGYTLGLFKDFNGTIEVNDQAQIQSAKSQVQAASIDTHNPVRDEGLKSSMFLDVAKFPQASFESTKVEGDQVAGLLTIKGIAKPLTLKIHQEAGKLLLKGSFNRNDYGITYNKPMGKNKRSIGDTVELIVEVKI